MLGGVARALAGLVGSLALSLSLAAPAASQLNLPPEQGPITLTADHIEYDQETGNVVADGHVVATRGSTTITADRLTGNLKTGDVDATGRVTLTQPGRTMTGESLHYNYQTRAGSMSQAVVKSAPWTLTGQTVSTAAGRGEVVAVSATPCDPAHPAFLIKAKRVVVVPGEYLTAYDAVLYAYGVPVFYVPTYTASLKPGRRASSGPTAGYDNLNGVWAEYRQFIPLGAWQAQIRARYATRSGLSGEAIIDRPFPDYVFDIHLGRTVSFDQNGVLFNLDQYTAEMDLYTHRLGPLTYAVTAQAGNFAETQSGINTFRSEGLLTTTLDAVHLTPSLTASAGGYYRYDAYGTGNIRNIVAASAAVIQTITRVSSAALSYNFATVDGATPFSFDAIAPDSAVTLSYSYYPTRGFFQTGTIAGSYDFLTQQTTGTLILGFALSPTLQFSSTVQYNVTTQQFSEIDYAVNVTCDCVSLGVVYRTFPLNPASNQWLITFGINTLPGIGTNFKIGGPP